MSVQTTIKNQLKAKVQACPSVQSVYGHEEINPEGYPAVFIKATDLQGEFTSTAENRRFYAFSVLVLYGLGSDSAVPSGINRTEYAEQVVATVIDEIINSVDNDFELDGSPVLFVDAADVVWGEYQAEGGLAKAGMITLKVCTEHNVFTNRES